MGFKPVGVDDTTSLFPTRVMNALRNLFAVKSEVEPLGLSSSTKTMLNAIYPFKSSLATIASTGLYTDLINKPLFAPIAMTGSYNDLTNKPIVTAQLIEDGNDPGTYMVTSNAIVEDLTDPGTYKFV